MLKCKYPKKLISLFVIVAFIFNIQSILLHSEELDDWDKQFNRSKEAYKKGEYTKLKEKIEWIIDNIPGRNDLLGKCHLLLGAVHEKMGENQKAEENYLKAKKEYGIESIEGLELENLEIFRKIIKGEKEQQDHVIPKEVPKKKKKKFPVLLVAAGAVAVTVVIVLLLKKKQKPEYSLTVNLGEGIEGSPPTGTTTYEEGTVVNYNYTLRPGYNNLVVNLDGTAVSSSGTITMNQNHTLMASAGTNDVNFVTDQDPIEIPEGGSASLNIRLSAQPFADVNVTVARQSGDTDISVISGGTLTFNTSNWNIDQTVTLQAAADADSENGQAIIAISAAGINQKNITVTELEPSFVTDKDSITIPEGDTASFNVKLSSPPAGNIDAEIARQSGDRDISVISGNNLTFTPTNWDTYQAVTLKADQDADTINGETTITISASGITTKTITAIEQDNDQEEVINVSITNPADGATVSGTVTIEAQASGPYGIAKVELYLGNQLLASDSSPPYQTDWDTTSELNGQYELRAVAHSNTGNTAQDKITVTVAN